MVKKSRPVVVWNNRASAYFKKAYERIKEDSYRNAEKVTEGITKTVESLPDHPEKHAPDKYKKNNQVTIVLLKNTPIALLIKSQKKILRY